jgi:hypothetical protein
MPADSPGLTPTLTERICRRRLPARLPQTDPDTRFMPGGQGVAGSNPAVPTGYEQVREGFGRRTVAPFDLREPDGHLIPRQCLSQSRRPSAASFPRALQRGIGLQRHWPAHRARRGSRVNARSRALCPGAPRSGDRHDHLTQRSGPRSRSPLRERRPIWWPPPVKRQAKRQPRRSIGCCCSRPPAGPIAAPGAARRTSGLAASGQIQDGPSLIALTYYLAVERPR